MTLRRLGALVGAITLVATGTYVFVYLYRWEWNRALISGVLFLAAEVAIVGWRIADRLDGMDRRLDDIATRRQALVVQRLDEAAPAGRPPFPWLARPDRLGVFIPAMLGAGMVLSGIAWVMERAARVTVRPIAHRQLAARIGTLSLPAHGFLGRPDDPLELLRRPVQ